MTDMAQQREAVTGRLSDLLASGQMSAKAAARGARLHDKLTAPIRIGVFGRPGAGKRAVLNGMLGADFVPFGMPVPTLELVGGPADHVHATMPDGTTQDWPGKLMLEHLTAGPIFLRIASPALLSLRRHYVLVMCDDDPRDLAAGMRWAAPRVDMAVWCSASWSRAEAALWAQAPDPLLHHAILCTTGVSVTHDDAAAYGFQSTIALGQDCGIEAVHAQLVPQLDRAIDDAVSQDLLAAEVFLQRFGPDLPQETATPRPVLVANSEISAVARTELSRLFRQVRKSARDLQHKLATEKTENSDILADFNQVFENLADHAAELDALAETWPSLEATFMEARDMAVLLQMEGRREQVHDAARLLLQVRGDMERQLAA